MYRISRARELLLSKPDMKIQDVAGASGFSDASHFIAMFRKITGTTLWIFVKCTDIAMAHTCPEVLLYYIKNCPAGYVFLTFPAGQCFLMF